MAMTPHDLKRAADLMTKVEAINKLLTLMRHSHGGWMPAFKPASGEEQPGYDTGHRDPFIESEGTRPAWYQLPFISQTQCTNWLEEQRGELIKQLDSLGIDTKGLVNIQ